MSVSITSTAGGLLAQLGRQALSGWGQGPAPDGPVRKQFGHRAGEGGARRSDRRWQSVPDRGGGECQLVPHRGYDGDGGSTHLPARSCRMRSSPIMTIWRLVRSKPFGKRVTVSKACKVIGFDALPFALQAIRDGVMAATVDQKPGAQIRTALRMMNEHLRSHAPLRSVKIEPVLIEKSNLQDAEITPSQ